MKMKDRLQFVRLKWFGLLVNYYYIFYYLYLRLVYLYLNYEYDCCHLWFHPLHKQNYLFDDYAGKFEVSLVDIEAQRFKALLYFDTEPFFGQSVEPSTSSY